MAAEAKDKPQATQGTANDSSESAAQTGASNSLGFASAPGFGAYGGKANPQKDLSNALDRPPASKLSGSLDFTDSDKRWLKDLGITTSDPQTHHHEWATQQEKYNHEHRKWNETTGGRVAMRSISRGIVGAAFYAMGNVYAGKAMKNYNPDSSLRESENALQFIAKCIDRSIGTGIFKATKAVSGINHSEYVASKTARDAVRGFRDTVHFAGYKVHGRSLGHEAVNVTFDFASMSFGDYMTRYFIGLTDPNAKSKWMKDGHIDVPGALKDVFANVFRGVTYAAGEDMAVAIPYVYGMRLQRNIIDHYSPGAKYDFDHGRDGGSFKVKDGKVVGDYQLEGMLHLMGRFSWYNVGTKMFRDAYSITATKLEKWWDGDRKIHMPHIDKDSLTPTNMALSVAHAARYVVRTTVKVMGYMIPATFFFFLTRTPQARVRGLAIDPEKGVLVREQKVQRPGANDSSLDATFEGVGKDSETVKVSSNFRKNGYASDITFKGYVNPETGLDYDIKTGEKYKGGNLFYVDGRGKRSDIGMIDEEHFPFDPDTRTSNREQAFSNKYYERSGHDTPFYQPFVNLVARVNYHAGDKLSGALQSLTRKHSSTLNPEAAKSFNKGLDKFARLYTNAAISYFPYFAMKTDVLSAEWDTARTDMGLDRSLDGVGQSIVGLVTFNGHKIKTGLGEFVAGMGETRRSLMREPFMDPKREEIAQKERWALDPEHGSNEAYQLNGISHRVKHETEKKTFAQESLKAKPVTPATFTQLKTPDSWAAQEALRKFQDASAPPQGQSVH